MISLMYAFLGLFIVCLDRITKYWALTLLHSYTVTSWLSFATTYNYGISWGMLQTHDPLCKIGVLSCIIAVTLLVAWYGRYHTSSLIQRIGITLILSGALSNLIDRFSYGAVVDFIELSYHQWIWPNFNIADVSIVFGVFLILVHDFIGKKHISIISPGETV